MREITAEKVGLDEGLADSRLSGPKMRCALQTSPETNLLLCEAEFRLGPEKRPSADGDEVEMSELPPAMPALPLTRLDGRAPFHDGAAPLGFDLAEFWAWNGSDLVGNTLRGALAEFVVARALGIRSEVRDEWNAWDLETAVGLRIEVKCSGFVQTWAQRDFSEPSFGIARRAGWTRTLGEFSKRQARWSDVFVFALHHHRDKPSADPLDLTQWRFLVMPTSTLDDECGDQKTIAPGALERMGGEWIAYSGLRTSFDRVVGCMPAPVRAPDDPAR